MSKLVNTLACVIDSLKGGLREWSGDAREWLKLRGLELAVLVAVWFVAAAIIFWLASGHESPRRYQDEFLVWGVAKAWAHGNGLTWRGTDLNLLSWLYPVMLAPAFWFSHSVATSYTLVHLLNSLYMTAVLFPAFFMARMYLDRWTSLLAALLAISVPAMNYAGVIGTETLAYFTSTAAYAAMLLSIVKPRPRNWALALATVLIAFLTRTQFIAYLPIYFAAIVLAGLMRSRADWREYFESQKWLLIASGAIAGLAGLIFLFAGKKVLGLYGGVFNGVSPSDVWFWIKAFTADVYIVVGFIPAIAALAMLFQKENRRDPLIGALLALVVVATLVFIAQITWFSATNQFSWRSRHIFYERYMFYLGPLYFTAFFAAFKRVSLRSAIISTVISCFIVLGFQTDAVLVPFSYDSFGLTLFGWYMDAHPGVVPHIGSFIARLTLLLGLVYLIATVAKEEVARIGMIISTVLVFGFLIAGQYKTWDDALLYSHDAFASFPRPANFIDKATEDDVGMIVTSTDAPEMYFQQEFWNDRIIRAFATDKAPFKSPVMYSPKCEFDWDRDGSILGTGCDKVPSAYVIRSNDIAVHLKDEIDRVNPSPLWPKVTLIVDEPPPRLLSIVDGRVVISGLVQGQMHVRTFLDNPGELRIRFASSRPPHVITVGKDVTKVPAGGDATITVPLPANDNEELVTIKTPKGLPDAAVVTSVEAREQGGDWISLL